MKCTNVLASLALASLAATAQARTAACSGGTGAAGYNSGFNAESNVIGHLWNNVHQGDCFRMEDFIEAVQVPFAGGGGGTFLRCRDEGLIDGLIAKVESISSQCINESLDNGTETGTFQGRIYCNVAVQQNIKAYATVVPLASVTASQACKVAFTTYVQQNCPAAANKPGFAQAVEGGCAY